MSYGDLMMTLERIVAPERVSGRIRFFKLVRDKIPLILRRKGVVFEVDSFVGDTVDDEEGFRYALRDKIVEEAVELLVAEGRSARIDEAVGLLSLVELYLHEEGVYDSEIRLVLRRIERERGKFTRKLRLLWTDDDGYLGSPED